VQVAARAVLYSPNAALLAGMPFCRRAPASSYLEDLFLLHLVHATATAFCFAGFTLLALADEGPVCAHVCVPALP